MKRFLLGAVAASLLAVPANAFEFGFDGAKSATAAELAAETGVETKFPEWVQGRVQAGQRDWFWDHCNDYINAMGLSAFTNPNRCLATHYRMNGERSLDRLNPGDVFWMVDLGSDPATVQAAFTAAAEAEAKAAADAAIAPIRDALLGNEEFRAEVAALVEGSAEGVNPFTTPEELEGLRAELFAELEKLGTGPSVEDLSALMGTLLDERGYFTSNVDAAVSEALEASDLPERLAALEGRVSAVEDSLGNLSTTVDQQGKAIANLPSEARVGEMIAGATEGLATEGRVGEMIADGTKGLPTEARVTALIDGKIATVNAVNAQSWNWIYGLTAAIGLSFVLMGVGYLMRRSRWKRLAQIETSTAAVLAAAQAAEGTATAAKATADAAKAAVDDMKDDVRDIDEVAVEAWNMASVAYAVAFSGNTIEANKGEWPDFQALALGKSVVLAVTNLEGKRAIIRFTRVERVSKTDARPGLQVLGIDGQSVPLPLDERIDRRVKVMLAHAAASSRINFTTSTLTDAIHAAQARGVAPAAPAPTLRHAAVPPTS